MARTKVSKGDFKGDINGARKSNDVLKASKSLETFSVMGEEIPVEVISKNIAQEVVNFLNEVDLPKKFNFLWVLYNINSIRKFIENIVRIVKENKNK